MDKSTDELRDHVCDMGDEGVKKFEIFMDVIDGIPLSIIQLDHPEKVTLKSLIVKTCHRGCISTLEAFQHD